MAKSKGVEACFKALERLQAGTPTVSDFVGVTPDLITPAMVSVEAGFDKGYLKRSRDNHKPIIARIDALKEDRSNTMEAKVFRANKAAERAAAEKQDLKQVLDSVLTQNLMLVERVRELEQELKDYKKEIKV